MPRDHELVLALVGALSFERHFEVTNEYAGIELQSATGYSFDAFTACSDRNLLVDPVSSPLFASFSQRPRVPARLSCLILIMGLMRDLGARDLGVLLVRSTVFLVETRESKYPRFLIIRVEFLACFLVVV